PISFLFHFNTTTTTGSYPLSLHDALPIFDQMKLAVTARTGNVAGVEDLVAGLEQGAVAADCFDDSGAVPAENAWLLQTAACSHANLGIDRVDRDSVNTYQQVTTLRLRLRDIHIHQRTGICYRQRIQDSDCFHIDPLLLYSSSSPAAGSGAPSANWPVLLHSLSEATIERVRVATQSTTLL